MFYALGSLASVVARNLKPAGQFHVARNCIVLDSVAVAKSDKPGVLVVTPNVSFDNQSHVAAVAVNPELLKQAEVSGPSFLEPGQAGLEFIVRPLVKDLDVAGLTYFAKLYVFDHKFSRVE